MFSKEVIIVIAIISILGVIGITTFLKGMNKNEVKAFPQTLKAELQSKLIEENNRLNSMLVSNYMDDNYKYFKDINGKTVRTLAGKKLNGYVVVYTGNDITNGMTFTGAPVSLNKGQIAIGFITNNQELTNCSHKISAINYTYLTGGTIANNKSDDAPICRGYDDTVRYFLFIGKSDDINDIYTNYLDKDNRAMFVNFGSTLSGLVLPLNK